MGKAFEDFDFNFNFNTDDDSVCINMNFPDFRIKKIKWLFPVIFPTV